MPSAWRSQKYGQSEEIKRYLSVNTALKGPAINGDVLLFVQKRVTLGNPDHLLDQVQTSNTLCDWMLHLGVKGYKSTKFSFVQYALLPLFNRYAQLTSSHKRLSLR